MNMLFSLSILLGVFLLFVLYEQKVKKWDFYSPIILLGGPLIFLTFLSFILNPIMGFIMVNSKAMNLFLLGLISFWLGGMFITPFILKFVRIEKNNEFRLKKGTKCFLHITCFLFICIMLLNLRSLLANRSLLMIEDQEFAQGGLEAHIGGLIMGYLIFYLICFWESFSVSKGLSLIFICTILFLKMLSGVRGNIILPLIGAGIYLLSRNLIKITPKYIIISVLGVFSLFILPTLFFNVENDTTFDYLLSYFVFYFNAGVLGLSSYMDQHYVPWEINPNFIFTFFINIWIKLFEQGNYVSAINSDFVTVTTSAAEVPFTSNVYTLIGEVYINCGYIVGSIYLFILGAYSYCLFFVANKNIMLLLLYSFVGGCLFLGMFSQYVLMPYFYEIQLLFIFLYFVSKMIIYKSVEKI